MSQTEDRHSLLVRVLDRHLIAASFLVYVIVCIPVYFWLVGPVGDVNTIDSNVVVASLAIGSIVFVPAIMPWLRKKKFQLGYTSMSDWEMSDDL